jgi:hypothetical protein
METLEDQYSKAELYEHEQEEIQQAQATLSYF